jgi:hypothetical protein
MYNPILRYHLVIKLILHYTLPLPISAEKRTSMRFGQSTMRFFGQTSVGSPFGGKRGAGPPIGVKSGVKSQSGATAEDLRDVASVSEMSCTSGDSTQASEDHEGKEKIVSLSSVVITDIDTVAQILKMVLRDLPEPVVTFATFESMMNVCVQFEVRTSELYQLCLASFLYYPPSLPFLCLSPTSQCIHNSPH